MSNDTDTTTPLDGDGHNVVEPDKGASVPDVPVDASPDDAKRVPPTPPPVEEPEDDTKVVLFTEVGHAFNSSREGTSTITDEGTEVDAADAEFIIDEAAKYGVSVTEKEAD